MDRAPYELTIREAAEALRSGALTSAALTESVLSRIEATEPRLNAYITVTAELAREQAAAADADLAAGRDRGPLLGIPMAFKDLFDVTGVATTGGNGYLRENFPERDAFVIERLREGGAVLLGKLGLHEFAMGTTSNNPHFGPVHNPWDTDRVPGGSSGGSGAAVAAGSCLGALGTDTGGSIRIPASLCGVVGLKPSSGRVSRSGVFPLSERFDHAGPLTRTVEDSALILQTIAGHDPDDPVSVDVPVPDYLADLERGAEGVRVGVPRDAQWAGASDEVSAACESALATLEGLGAKIEDVSLPLMAKTERLLISSAESAVVHAEWLETHPERFGSDVRERLERGAAMKATEYIAELRWRDELTREIREVLRGVDVLVSPTTPITAPTIERGDADKILGRYTRSYNYVGVPALSMPCGFDRQGLPIGLMIAGRQFEDATVLRVGYAFEAATEWRLARPSL